MKIFHKDINEYEKEPEVKPVAEPAPENIDYTGLLEKLREAGKVGTYGTISLFYQIPTELAKQLNEEVSEEKYQKDTETIAENISRMLDVEAYVDTHPDICTEPPHDDPGCNFFHVTYDSKKIKKISEIVPAGLGFHDLKISKIMLGLIGEDTVLSELFDVAIDLKNKTARIVDEYYEGIGKEKEKLKEFLEELGIERFERWDEN